VGEDKIKKGKEKKRKEKKRKGKKRHQQTPTVFANLILAIQ